MIKENLKFLGILNSHVFINTMFWIFVFIIVLAIIHLLTDNDQGGFGW